MFFFVLVLKHYQIIKGLGINLFCVIKMTLHQTKSFVNKIAAIDKKYLLLFLFMVLSSSNLFSGNFYEAPQVPWNEYNDLFYFFMTNDGFGYDLGEECDDFRTFGFSTGFFSHYHYFISLDFHSLTNRAAIIEDHLIETTIGPQQNVADSSRIDELKIIVGYTLINMNHSIFYFKASCGTGLLFFGNMGTEIIQTSFHNIFGFDVPRPLPEFYDPRQINLLGFLNIDIGENILQGFNVKAYAHVTHNLDYYIDCTLGYWIPKEFLQLFYSVSYTFNSFSTYPVSAQAVYNSEKGLWCHSLVTAGPFYLKRSVNICSQTPAGSIGFRLNWEDPEHSSNNIRFDYSLGGVFGFISNIEILRIHPLSFFPQLSLYSWIQKHEDFNTYQKMLRLHIQTIGIDLSLFNPGTKTFVNPFAYLGYGFVSERHVTNDQFRARILDKRLLQIMHLGVGGRIKLSDIFNNTDFEYGMEFSWNLRFSYGADSLYSNAKSTVRYSFYVSE